jgi:hypothetical protein
MRLDRRFDVIPLFFRHDGACPPRALTDWLDVPGSRPPRFRVASAASGGGRYAETLEKRDIGVSF